jgi:hypothetical protein
MSTGRVQKFHSAPFNARLEENLVIYAREFAQMRIISGLITLEQRALVA